MVEISSKLNPRQVLRDLTFDEKERWAVPVHTHMKVVDPVVISQEVIVKDDTLRESTNMPGSSPTDEQKLELAKKLEAIGVREIVGGHAGIKDQCDLMRRFKESCPKMMVHAYVDFGDWKRGIDMAVSAGVDAIWMPGALHMSPAMAGKLGSSYAMWSPDFDLSTVLESATAAIKTAKDKGKLITIGRVPLDPKIFYDTLDAYVRAGADRIAIGDGKGHYTPQMIGYHVKMVRDVVGPDVKIEVHCHDDFGFALANSVESVRAGAEVVDCVLNGYSHRSGNCALDQIVLALEVLYGVRTGVDLKQLMSLCQFAAEIFGVPIPGLAPHIGAWAYAYGGTHIGAILQEGWFVWEALKAETIGQRRHVVWTPTALERHGMAGPVGVKIQTMGLKCDEKQLQQVFEKLRKVMAQKKIATDEDVEAAVHEVLGK